MIPLKESLLLPWSTNFNDRIVASGAAFGLSSGQVALYTPLHQAFLSAYHTMMLARAEGTRSESQTATKNETKANLLNYARQLYKIVQANQNVSDADKISLRIHVPVQPSSIPRPEVSPGMNIIGVTGRTVKLHIHDRASSAKRGKPSGATAAWVYSFVGSEYPSDPTQWHFEGAATKAKFDVVFPPEIAGGTNVWVRAAWINTKHEPGPLSAAMMTTLQGGGAVVQSGEIKAA